jgi:aryl-alcohol dehydrogenase-like predicted oxidoreductase
MEYKKIGNSGVKVSELCLGCMMFGGPADEAESVKIINRALDAGINFLDTANWYANKNSEVVVGKAIKGKRDKIVLATKVYGKMGEGPNDYGCSRYHIMREVENSLRRLDTDHIDLYQLHRYDPETPLEETMRALDDLVRQGKVCYVGCSNFPAWAICKALWVSDKMGLEPFASCQPRYNAIDRKIETEVIPCCLEHGIGLIVYSPLFRGFLTGKYKRGEALPEGSRAARGDVTIKTAFTESNFDVLEKMTEMARVRGKTVSQYAIAWTLANPAVTSSIIGPRTLEQLEDNLGSIGWKLSPEELKKIDEISPPPG